MAIYIQTPNGLYPIGGQVISGQVTKSKIIEALGYTPSAFNGDYNSLNNRPEIIEDGSDNFYIVDTQGNIIFKVDSNGIHSVNLTLDGKTINQLIQESIPNDGGGTSGEDGEDGREVELQVSSTHIQWRYVGDSTWTDLVSLEDLKGATGATGPSGTLNTNNTTTLTPSSNESLADGVSLHKVSKTGDYDDLSNKPTIPTVPTISTDIANDAESNIKTASPKAVKSYVDNAISTVIGDIDAILDSILGV